MRFHDGSALDAETATVSLRRAQALPGVFARAPLTAIEVDGDAVLFRLEKPYAALPALLANYATMILAPAAFDAEGKVVSFLATGPFKVDAVTPPLSLSVSRFEDYWGEKPAIARASYLSSHRPETRAMQVESGDADLAVTLDPAGYARLKADPSVAVQAAPIPRVILVKLNLARGPLADVEARRALSLAVDREGVAAGVLRFPEAAATQLFPPVLPMWHDPSLPPLRHDPDEARALLAGLGWAPGADGVLERDGARFSLELRTFPNRPELPLIAAALQDQWKAIGVELKVSVGNSSDIPAGHRDGSLDMALAARNYALTPDPVVNAADDFGPGGGDWGAMNWEAPAVAAALDRALAESDPAARSEAVAEIAAALHEALPVIPIAWYIHTAASDARLSGVALDPLERRYGLASARWAE